MGSVVLFSSSEDSKAALMYLPCGKCTIGSTDLVQRLKSRKICTVWKFHDFSTTQILREINFWNFRSAKSAILTNLEALKFDFYEFFHLLKAEIYPIDKIQSP